MTQVRTVRADAGPRYTPFELARLLHQPAPTAQQAEVIAAPVAPLLVVAGAGSGKTETMAARVLWLVANNHARPEQILGLTFTRKAAGELAHRIRARLAQLVRRLGRDDLIAGEPTVATYHSYATRVVREHGLRAGFEPSTRLLTEAACWQLAESVVRAYDGDMVAVSQAPSTVIDAVLHLAGDLAEHLRSPAEVAAFTGRFFAEVSAKSGKMPGPYTLFKPETRVSAQDVETICAAARETEAKHEIAVQCLVRARERDATPRAPHENGLR